VRDAALPIDHTSRRLVPTLWQEGYEVEYREFENGHTVPPDLIRDAIGRFLDGGASGQMQTEDSQCAIAVPAAAFH
jgi:hypothetical protein